MSATVFEDPVVAIRTTFAESAATAARNSAVIPVGAATGEIRTPCTEKVSVVAGVPVLVNATDKTAVAVSPAVIEAVAAERDKVDPV